MANIILLQSLRTILKNAIKKQRKHNIIRNITVFNCNIILECVHRRNLKMLYEKSISAEVLDA